MYFQRNVFPLNFHNVKEKAINEKREKERERYIHIYILLYLSILLYIYIDITMDKLSIEAKQKIENKQIICIL